MRWQRRAARALHARADAHEAMLLQQSLRIAHRPVMALDEDPPAPRCHHAGRRKRPRAHGQNLYRLAASREIVSRARTSAKFSGGQSGSTSVPSMPCAFAVALIAKTSFNRTADLESVMRRQPHRRGRAQVNERVAVTRAGIFPVALVGDVIRVEPQSYAPCSPPGV
jgi:hypothetical protein